MQIGKLGKWTYRHIGQNVLAVLQITDHYQPEDLIGRQVMAVVNFPPRQIADFMSEVLVLGTYSQGGVVLITPDRTVENGDKLG